MSDYVCGRLAFVEFMWPDGRAEWSPVCRDHADKATAVGTAIGYTVQFRPCKPARCTQVVGVVGRALEPSQPGGVDANGQPFNTVKVQLGGVSPDLQQAAHHTGRAAALRWFDRLQRAMVQEISDVDESATYVVKGWSENSGTPKPVYLVFTVDQELVAMLDRVFADAEDKVSKHAEEAE